MITPLKAGDDVRLDWRSINELIADRRDLAERVRRLEQRFQNPNATNVLGPVPYRLKRVRGDYLLCTYAVWTGTAWSDGYAQLYPIAKPPKLRHSIATETIEAVPYYYDYPITGVGATDAGGSYLSRFRKAYSHATERTAGYLVETCLVTPEWLPDDIIYALPCADTGVAMDATDQTLCAADVAGVYRLMLDEGRAWAVQA